MNKDNGSLNTWLEAWLKAQKTFEAERIEMPTGVKVNRRLYDMLPGIGDFGPVHRMFCTPIPRFGGKTYGQVCLEEGAIDDRLLLEVLTEEMKVHRSQGLKQDVGAPGNRP
ncbi:MAG: hypothetical protein AAFQ55_06800 [Pseudomonadota bacterium]